MFSVRFVRVVALALGLAWLPVSAFAQICATHSMAMNIGGAHHPAMPQTVEEAHAAHIDRFGQDAVVIVIDAETFWHSVDSYDETCQSQSAMCALAATAVPPSANARFDLDPAQTMIPLHSHFPRSIERAPETPPPRTYK